MSWTLPSLDVWVIVAGLLLLTPLLFGVVLPWLVASVTKPISIGLGLLGSGAVVLGYWLRWTGSAWRVWATLDRSIPHVMFDYSSRFSIINAVHVYILYSLIVLLACLWLGTMFGVYDKTRVWIRSWSLAGDKSKTACDSKNSHKCGTSTEELRDQAISVSSR